MLEGEGDGYLTSVPGIRGRLLHGGTMEEAVFNCIDVIKLIAACRKERGKTLGFNTVVMTPESSLIVASSCQHPLPCEVIAAPCN